MRRRYNKRPVQLKKGNEQFFKPSVQTKLNMGKPGDRYEVEADRMADQVVSKSSKETTVQKKEGEDEVQQKPLASSITPLIQKMETGEDENVQAKQENLQRKEEEKPVQMKEEEEVQAKCDDCEKDSVQKKEDEEIQAKSNTQPQQKPSIESKLRNGSGGGKMDANTRGEMELGFGSDFSNVNIHTDGEAAQMSQDIGAQAFTHGNDVYFNKGKYNPNSTEGKHLLAHELTHTIQQKGMVQMKVQKKGFNSTLDFSKRLFSRKFRKGVGPLKLNVDSYLDPSSCTQPTKFSVKLTNLTLGKQEGTVDYKVDKNMVYTWNINDEGQYQMTFVTDPEENCRIKGNIKVDYPTAKYTIGKTPGEVALSTYGGIVPIPVPISSGQWYGPDRESNPRISTRSFWKASVYNALNDNHWAYRNISQRHAFYDFADAYLNRTSTAIKSKWFKAAAIVTGRFAVGAADNLNLWYLSDNTEKFLQAGNEFLFKYNMKNFKYLMQGKEIPGMKGLSGQVLDERLVEFEQKKVEEFIKSYKGPGTLQDMIDQINSSFSAYMAPDEVKTVIQKHFTDKGITFNFKNYKHRETLGKQMVADLYKK